VPDEQIRLLYAQKLAATIAPPIASAPRARYGLQRGRGQHADPTKIPTAALSVKSMIFQDLANLQTFDNGTALLK
jgi:hypothetical protein